jgi:hypothetical protein
MERLAALRRYADDAPWSVTELAKIADQVLSRAMPGSKATTERTVRFYVSRGVVRPPQGRGAGAFWGYPQLIELLAARIAQHEGAALDDIAARRTTTSLETMERGIASRLTEALPPPGVALQGEPVPADIPVGWQRLEVSDGVELHLRDGHPLLSDTRRLGAVLGDLRSAIASKPEAT